MEFFVTSLLLHLRLFSLVCFLSVISSMILSAGASISLSLSSSLSSLPDFSPSQDDIQQVGSLAHKTLLSAYSLRAFYDAIGGQEGACVMLRLALTGETVDSSAPIFPNGKSLRDVSQFGVEHTTNVGHDNVRVSVLVPHSVVYYLVQKIEGRGEQAEEEGEGEEVERGEEEEGEEKASAVVVPAASVYACEKTNAHSIEARVHPITTAGESTPETTHTQAVSQPSESVSPVSSDLIGLPGAQYSTSQFRRLVGRVAGLRCDPVHVSSPRKVKFSEVSDRVEDCRV